MANELIIRQCRRDEARDVLSLWREAETTVSVTDTLESLQQAINHSAAIVLIAEKDGGIVGSIIGAFDGWRGNIYRLAVHPKHRRQGIASKLLSEVESHIAELGAKRITALVEKDHHWATGFWESAGYALDAGMARYFHNL